jgi:hypothetical protein
LATTTRRRSIDCRCRGIEDSLAAFYRLCIRNHPFDRRPLNLGDGDGIINESLPLSLDAYIARRASL